MKKILLILILTSLVTLLSAETLKEQAQAKIVELEALVAQAENKDLDTEREKLALWVANEFLRFADWDESAEGVAINEREFAKFSAFESNNVALAAALPDRERQDVITVLNTAISELNEVINGTMVRPAVRLVDWENVICEDDELISNGKPVFIYDYFSKSQGTSTDNDTVYNDYLGNVDHPKSINNHYLDENLNVVDWRINQLKDHVSTRLGYTMLWHKGDASWQNETNIPEVDKGISLFVTYDIDNPTMRDVWAKTLEESASVLRGKKITDLGYCLANEPHWFSSGTGWPYNQGEMNDISSYTLTKFQEWLKNKYDNDINAFDQTWQVYYSSFDQIKWTMPVPASYKGTAKWYDWCRFNMDRVNDWFAFLQTTIQTVDPDAPTHVKVMPNLFTNPHRHHGIDYESIIELTTYMGDDAKTHKRYNTSTTPDEWETYYAYYWEELAFAYDFMESVAPNKIHVNSESHFLSTTHWRDADMQPAYVRNVYWLATVLGMDANFSWFWARDPDGTIEDRFFPDGNYTEDSYPASAAQQPLVVNEYAKVMMDLNSCSEDIMSLRKQERPMRIFYSETSAINDESTMPNLKELYTSMFFDGIPMGFSTKNIIEKQDNDLWKAIVIYKTTQVTDEEFSALQTYLDNGGTIIIDNGRSLIKNEYGIARATSLSESNGTMISLGASATLSQVKTKAYEVLESEKKLPEIRLSQDNGLDRDGCMWRMAPNDKGYLLTIMNVGKSMSDIEVSLKNGSAISSIKDVLTGKEMGTSFTIDSEGTLMLQVFCQTTALDRANDISEVRLITKKKALIVNGAENRELTIYNLLGQHICSQRIASNNEMIELGSGVFIVSVDGIGAQKIIVQ